MKTFLNNDADEMIVSGASYNHIDYLRSNIDSVYFNKLNGIEYFLAGYDIHNGAFIMSPVWNRFVISMDNINPSNFLKTYVIKHERLETKYVDLTGHSFIYKDKVYKVKGRLRRSDNRLILMSHRERSKDSRYLLTSIDAKDYFKSLPKKRSLGGLT